MSINVCGDKAIYGKLISDISLEGDVDVTIHDGKLIDYNESTRNILVDASEDDIIAAWKLTNKNVYVTKLVYVDVDLIESLVGMTDEEFRVASSKSFFKYFKTPNLILGNVVEKFKNGNIVEAIDLLVPNMEVLGTVMLHHGEDIETIQILKSRLAELSKISESERLELERLSESEDAVSNLLSGKDTELSETKDILNEMRENLIKSELQVGNLSKEKSELELRVNQLISDISDVEVSVRKNYEDEINKLKMDLESANEAIALKDESVVPLDLFKSVSDKVKTLESEIVLLNSKEKTISSISDVSIVTEKMIVDGCKFIYIRELSECKDMDCLMMFLLKSVATQMKTGKYVPVVVYDDLDYTLTRKKYESNSSYILNPNVSDVTRDKAIVTDRLSHDYIRSIATETKSNCIIVLDRLRRNNDLFQGSSVRQLFAVENYSDVELLKLNSKETIGYNDSRFSVNIPDTDSSNDMQISDMRYKVATYVTNDSVKRFNKSIIEYSNS